MPGPCLVHPFVIALCRCVYRQCKASILRSVLLLEAIDICDVLEAVEVCLHDRFASMPVLFVVAVERTDT
jgi:hypothetical protein